MEEKNALDWYYVSLFILEICALQFVAFLGIKIIKSELRDYYFDWLKININFSFILMSILWTAERLVDIFGKYNDVANFNCSEAIENAIRLNIFITSVMYWILMIIYIRNLKKLHSGGEFDKIKTKIRIYELFFILILALNFFIRFVFQIAMLYYELKDNCFIDDGRGLIGPACKEVRAIIKIMNHANLWSILLLLLLQIISYFLLNKYLRTNLYYYYHQTKKDLLVLFIWNWTYYVATIIKLIFQSFEVVDVIRMERSRHDTDDYEPYQRVLWSFLQIFNWVAIFIYWYFNSKNIYFKVYVYAYMRGHQIENRFKGMSLFIKQSWWFKAKVESEYEIGPEESSLEPTIKGLTRAKEEFEQTTSTLYTNEESNEHIYKSIVKDMNFGNSIQDPINA